jgi:PKD repeat protein
MTMKRTLLLFALVLSAAIGFAQYATRSMVVVEVATGTWCTYCPGAAMGVDDMLENGDSVAVIENHDNDNYATAASAARNTMWNVSGVPSTTFDGMLGVVGGSHSSSLFTTFQPLYEQRIVAPAPLTMDLTETHNGLAYDVTITLTKLNTYTGNTVNLIFAVTESHIQQTWQGQTELNFVNRMMVPDASGTPVSFSGGDVQTVHLTFSLNASWNKDNLEFVAFFQNLDAGQGNIPNTNNPPYGSLIKHQTFQGIKYAVTPLTADYSADATQIARDDSVHFTNLSFGGFMFVPETYEWTLPGATPDHSTDKNPAVVYSECGYHDVTLTITAGGLSNTLLRPNYIQVGPIVNIASIPSDTVCAPQTITLNGTIVNAASYLWTPGGATTAMITLDPGVIGLGSHTYSLLATSTDGCSSSDTVTVVFEDCTGIQPVAENFSVSAYPNPNQGTFTLELNVPQAGNTRVDIINPLGKAVFTNSFFAPSGKSSREIQLDNAASGIYIIKVQAASKLCSQKIFIR